MADRMLDLLTRLNAVVGVSGDEERVAAVIGEELEGAYDDHLADALGNHVFTRRGADSAPTVMLCAHMDELGFVVSHVEDEGFVRIAPVGYHDDRMVIDQVLRIHGTDGPVDGVTGAKPAHLLTIEERAKAIPLHDLFLDVGSSSRAETQAMGVRKLKLLLYAFINAKTDQSFLGKVLAVTDLHVVLSLGRSVGILSKSDLSRVPAMGEDATIVFKDGQGLVADAARFKSADKGR